MFDNIGNEGLKADYYNFKQKKKHPYNTSCFLLKLTDSDCSTSMITFKTQIQTPA